MKAVDLLDGRDKPADWSIWSESERLDWIAGRILAEDRDSQESTSHEDIKGGFYYGYSYLSDSQEERRKKKEVYLDVLEIPARHDWLDKKLESGQVFSRSYTAIFGHATTPTSPRLVAKARLGKGIDPIKYLDYGNIPSSYRNTRTSTD